jgi:hypothetical protein
LTAFTASTTPAAAAGCAYDVIVGDVRGREIQRRVAVPAVTAMSAVCRAARTANPGLPDDHAHGGGVMRHANEKQRQPPTQLKCHLPRLAFLRQRQIRMSQCGEDLGLHHDFILGGGSARNPRRSGLTRMHRADGSDR